MTAYTPDAASLKAPTDLAQALIRRPSVTPVDAGALDVLETALTALGFTCTRLPFEEEGAPRVDNLYARLGTQAPHFCFAGHTDVVPAGIESAWDHGPFEAAIDAGTLYGRGAADMKGAIASFVAGAARFLQDHGTPKGSISLLITGDEEGDAINGTRQLVRWLKDKGETIDHCLVGEPTNPHALGEMVKIGRRGSLNAILTVIGQQGHVAYPDRACNPVPLLIEILSRLEGQSLDMGADGFQPSNLEITTIDVGNETTNVIPGRARARLNIRFNTHHTGADLSRWITETAEAVLEGTSAQLDSELMISGEAFYTEPCGFTDLVSTSVASVTGRTPELSTGGGTSDARFIKDLCPVCEFGLVGETMHKVNERVELTHLEQLAEIYHTILSGYFEDSA